MSKPTIKEARELSKRHNLNGCIIIWFDEDQFGAICYGRDRARCGDAAYVADDIVDALERGAGHAQGIGFSRRLTGFIFSRKR